MTRTLRLISTVLLPAALLAGCGTGGDAEAKGKPAGDVKAATRLLGNAVLQGFPNVDHDGGRLEQEIHLCRDGRYVVISKTLASGAVTRTDGRWAAERARVRKGARTGTVTFAYTYDGGIGGRRTAVIKARSATLDGKTVEVGRSALCRA